MMKLVYKLVLALGLALLIAAPTGEVTGRPPATEKHEFTKNIKKEVQINSNGMVGLTNKYGKIDVKTWDKNRVKFDIKIIVMAMSETSAQEVFDRVNINFSNSSEYVKAQTVIGEPQKNAWWSSWDTEEKKTEFKINYEVYMPKNGSLQLTNKYEDSFIEAINGDAEINVSYGNFRLEGANDLMLNLNHGGGTVMTVKNVIGEISNSNRFRIKKAHDVLFTTNNSRITLEKANEVKIDSRNDAFNFDEIGKLKFQGRYGDIEANLIKEVYATGRYSDFYIENLTKNADFDLQFGGVTIENISKGFSEVSLYGRHTAFKVAVQDGVSYKLDATAESAGISYPDNLSVTNEKDHGVAYEVQGYQGSSNTNSIILAKINYGGLRID